MQFNQLLRIISLREHCEMKQQAHRSLAYFRFNNNVYFYFVWLKFYSFFNMEKARPDYKIVKLRLCQEQKSSSNTPICDLRKSWIDQRKTRRPWKGLYNHINHWKPQVMHNISSIYSITCTLTSSRSFLHFLHQFKTFFISTVYTHSASSAALVNYSSKQIVCYKDPKQSVRVLKKYYFFLHLELGMPNDSTYYSCWKMQCF